MSDLLKLSIPGKPEYVQMLRLAVGSVAGQAQFDMETVEDIKVAVEEACKLVTCHGNEGWLASYEVACELSEAKLVITISDNCGCQQITKSSKMCQNCPGEGNLAMFIIESLMDEMELTRSDAGSKCIRMVKNR